MKTFKKILCILLVVAMCLTSAPLQGVIGIEWPGFDFYTWLSTKANAVTYTEEYYTYRIENDEAIITNVDTSISGDIIVPDSLGGHTVVGFEGGIYADDGFYNCDMVTSVHLPKTIKNVDTAFYFVPNLKEISVDEVNPYLKAVDGVLYNKDMTRMLVYPSAKEYADFVVPASVKVIDGYQNSGSSRIKTLSFEQGSQLEVFYGNSLFYFSIIDELIIPKSCSIENMAIGGSCWVESLKFEEGREEETFIDDYDRLGGLRNIDLPTSFIGIGERSLNSWDLKTVTIRNRNCLIYDSADTIASHTVIYGYMNSTAHAYAKKYARTFVDIETGIVYENLDKVRIEFRFADTKEIIDTSDEHLMDQQVAFNFTTTEDVHRMKMATNGVLYLEEYYFPLKYFKADWQSAFGDRVYYICKSTKKIDAKAGDTIVIYLSVDENAGSVVTPPSGGGDGGSDSGDDTLETKVFPTGYNFEEDSYGFENDDSFIPYGYFKTMYNDGKAWALFTKKWLQEGVCFGMTYTTASLYNSFPSVRTIRDLSKDSILSIGNYDLSLEAFIDYAHIYQFSEEFSNGTVWTNGTTIYNLVKEYLNNDCIGVTIGMTKRNGSGGHRVLAVGIDGDDILIDDPNNMNDYERLTVNSDGSWTFSGLTNWNSDTCYIRYNLDYLEPYKFIKSMNPLNVKDSFIDNFTIDKIAQNSTSNYLSSDSVLLSVDADEYNLENSNITKIELDYSDESDLIETPKLYWIDKNETVTISNINSDNSEIEVAGNENVIKLNLDKSSEINVTIDEENNVIKATIDTVKGDNCEIDNISFDNISNPVTLNISCVAESDTITTCQTETGLIVTGIEDGTITLSKNDEAISTQTITDAESDIEIIYDKNGNNDSLKVEYKGHKHTYTPDITKEASCTENGECVYFCYCGYTYSEKLESNGHNLSDWYIVNPAKCEVSGAKQRNCSECDYSETQQIAATGHDFDGSVCKNCDFDKADACGCKCHKTGFISKIIWFITNFFNKLFKKNQVCDCGKVHF